MIKLGPGPRPGARGAAGAGRAGIRSPAWAAPDAQVLVPLLVRYAAP
jgi:hypothetical protein